MAKVKLICILNHEPNEVIHAYNDLAKFKKRFPETESIRINKPPYWVVFFKNDFHSKWSRYILRNSADFEIECWRPYGNTIDEVYKKSVDGVVHKVFPSKKFRVRKLGEIMISSEMLRHIHNEAKINRVIVHFYGAHTNFQSWLLWKLRKCKVPIILQQLGGSFGWFEFKYNKSISGLISYGMEKRLIAESALYLSASSVELEFLGKKFPGLNYKYFLNGIDFNEFVPVDKSIAKKDLGYDSKSKVILYVGRNTRTKNVDLLLRAFKEIRLRDERVRLLLVGGYAWDEFTPSAIDAGATVIERSDQPITVYFNAADVYVMPITNPITLNFGGFGIAPIEAIACGTPVVSNNLIHFPGTEEERGKLGLLFGEADGLAAAIQKALSLEYKECRQVARKYFDINDNTRKLIGFYKAILQEA